MITFPTQKETVLENNRFNKLWFTFLENVYKLLGDGRNVFLGGLINVDTTPIGNITTGEDDLQTFTLQSNILKYNNEILEIKAYGTFEANANNKTIKMYFGSTKIFDSGAIAINGGSFSINATIIRKTSNTQDIIVECIGTNSGLIKTYYTTATEDLTTNIDIKLTGEATSTDDIIQKGMIIKLELNN